MMVRRLCRRDEAAARQRWLLTGTAAVSITCTPTLDTHASDAGLAVVKWPSEKNKDSGNCACIVTVFGMAYFTT
jgi:hypothetical protein